MSEAFALTNVLIVGVGGQGTILASKVLGNVALRYGLDVKQSEVHGMAQRGGSVVTYVRFGPSVSSPLVEKGEADFVLAFEKLEALRWGNYLKPQGKLIVNEQVITPMPVLLGKAQYPTNIYETIANRGYKLKIVEALKQAQDLGQPKAINVVLLGALAREMPFSVELWEDALIQEVPPKAIELNLEGFRRGLKM